MKNFIFSRDGQFSVYGGVLVAGDIEAYRIGIDMGTDASGMTAMAVCQENGEYSSDYEMCGNRIFVALVNSMYRTPGHITVRLAVSKGDSVITAKEIRFKVAPPNNSDTLAENESGTIDNILTSVKRAEAAAQQVVSTIDNYALKADTYTKDEVDSKISSVYKYRGSYKNFDTFTLYIDELANAEVGYVWNIAEDSVLLSQFSASGKEEKINAGDNIAVVQRANGNTAPKFDILAGTVDLSGCATKEELSQGIENAKDFGRNALNEAENLKINTYTKTEVNDKILDEREYLVNGYYTKGEVDSKISSAIGTALEGEY